MAYSISVVIPVYNEEKNVGATLKRLVPVLKNNFFDYEVIIVESGSTDKSSAIIDNFARKNKKIIVIHQKKKMGYSNAIRTGFMECKKELSIFVDCDLPYDFKYLADASKYMRDYDAVLGYRVGKRGSLGRLIMSKGANILAKVLFNINVKDVGFPFKMIRTRLLKNFNLVSNNSFIREEILIELKKHNARTKEIPIPYQARIEGKSKFSNFSRTVKGHLVDIFNYMRK